MNPKFSIIVPIYKTEMFLQKCIDSIIHQTFSDFQLILIDDGSPDKCPIICDAYAKNDCRITVIHQMNSGVSIARQKAVAIAKGRYLVFVDSDDWVSIDFLESMNNIIEKNNPDIICFGGYNVTNRGQEKRPFSHISKFYNRKSIIKQLFPYLIEDSKGNIFPNGLCHKIIKRDIFLKNQIKSTTIDMGEDGACSKPCIYHAKSLYVDNGVYYYYRRNDDSVTMSGKPLLWDGPALIAEHYSKHIDLSKYDFQNQVDRNVVHNLFNVAVSQYSNNESYFEISKKIKKELKNPVYSTYIKKAKFSSLSGIICEYAIKYKLCFVFYLRWLQKYGLNSIKSQYRKRVI